MLDPFFEVGYSQLVQGRLGHADVETTFKYYAHLWTNADQEAIGNLERERNKHKNYE